MWDVFNGEMYPKKWPGSWRYMDIFAVLFIITHYKYTEAVQQLWPGTIGQDKCTSGRGLKYISGDALTDSPNCIGPNSAPYPRASINLRYTIQ
ncbi:uncharacterized protein LOC129801100 [Phlebotomus papatasi]|uniref:uncharacterized protein LOC129801100 n=1 Tax=Phlebotomus papatasi TaxID=29031 RepID=UPI0024834069|nr:uncharacterized protein LOC129801100 [Phlebotomus papatasi]